MFVCLYLKKKEVKQSARNLFANEGPEISVT